MIPFLLHAVEKIDCRTEADHRDDHGHGRGLVELNTQGDDEGPKASGKKRRLQPVRNLRPIQEKCRHKPRYPVPYPQISDEAVGAWGYGLHKPEKKKIQKERDNQKRQGSHCDQNTLLDDFGRLYHNFHSPKNNLTSLL